MGNDALKRLFSVDRLLTVGLFNIVRIDPSVASGLPFVRTTMRVFVVQEGTNLPGICVVG